MGADGHIYIYDFNKLEEILGVGKILTGATTYIQTYRGEKLVTDYHGDNLWIHYCLACGIDAYSSEHDDKKCNDLIKPALIAEWEVWT